MTKPAYVPQYNQHPEFILDDMIAKMRETKEMIRSYIEVGAWHEVRSHKDDFIVWCSASSYPSKRYGYRYVTYDEFRDRKSPSFLWGDKEDESIKRNYLTTEQAWSIRGEFWDAVYLLLKAYGYDLVKDEFSIPVPPIRRDEIPDEEFMRILLSSPFACTKFLAGFIFAGVKYDYREEPCEVWIEGWKSGEFEFGSMMSENKWMRLIEDVVSSPKYPEVKVTIEDGYIRYETHNLYIDYFEEFDFRYFERNLIWVKSYRLEEDSSLSRYAKQSMEIVRDKSGNLWLHNKIRYKSMRPDADDDDYDYYNSTDRYSLIESEEEGDRLVADILSDTKDVMPYIECMPMYHGGSTFWVRNDRGLNENDTERERFRILEMQRLIPRLER